MACVGLLDTDSVAQTPHILNESSQCMLRRCKFSVVALSLVSSVSLLRAVVSWGPSGGVVCFFVWL